jgi:hypothetical protein
VAQGLARQDHMPLANPKRFRFAEVFHAIKNIRGWWWVQIEGHADTLGAEFTYRYKDLHLSKQKVTEFIPGKKVIWHVLDSHPGFVKDGSQWRGTDIIFEISENQDMAEVSFTHVGLVPQFECYGSCSNAWATLINGNLRKLITTGEGRMSNPYGQKSQMD